MRSCGCLFFGRNTILTHTDTHYLHNHKTWNAKNQCGTPWARCFDEPMRHLFSEKNILLFFFLVVRWFVFFFVSLVYHNPVYTSIALPVPPKRTKHSRFSVNYKRLSNVLFDKDARRMKQKQNETRKKKYNITASGTSTRESICIRLLNSTTSFLANARHWALLLGTAGTFPFKQFVMWVLL